MKSMQRRQVLKAIAAAVLAELSTAARAQNLPKSARPEDGSMSRTTQKTVSIEHVTIASTKPFEDIRAALEALVPRLDDEALQLLRDGKPGLALARLERGPALSIFGSRDHGGLLQIAGLRRKAIQYDIGNPLTASKMTRHRISAALYAPIRVLLRESPEGYAAFEYDSPKSVFGQFDDKEVDKVAGELDVQLRHVLEQSAA
jgi:hypothetical protein